MNFFEILQNLNPLLRNMHLSTYSLLPPAYVVRGKVLFSQVSVCPHLWGGGGGYHLPRSRWEGYPLLRSRQGVSPSQVQVGGGTYWNSIACTCYAAGGMPLAFTQEDFLVSFILSGCVDIIKSHFIQNVSLLLKIN